jgi:hypothetical protein
MINLLVEGIHGSGVSTFVKYFVSKYPMFTVHKAPLHCDTGAWRNIMTYEMNKPGYQIWDLSYISKDRHSDTNLIDFEYVIEKPTYITYIAQSHRSVTLTQESSLLLGYALDSMFPVIKVRNHSFGMWRQSQYTIGDLEYSLEMEYGVVLEYLRNPFTDQP